MKEHIYSSTFLYNDFTFTILPPYYSGNMALRFDTVEECTEAKDCIEEQRTKFMKLAHERIVSLLVNSDH